MFGLFPRLVPLALRLFPQVHNRIGEHFNTLLYALFILFGCSSLVSHAHGQVECNIRQFLTNFLDLQ